jgi:hypothetical protein
VVGVAAEREPPPSDEAMFFATAVPDAPPTLMREAIEPEAAEASATPSEAATPTPAPAPPPERAPEQSADELYELVVSRLRRDLLVERERMGDLLGDLP